MSVSQTMAVAQRLYEAGYITYMRTDSVNLSNQALAAAKEEITVLFGAEYSEVRELRKRNPRVPRRRTRRSGPHI